MSTRPTCCCDVPADGIKPETESSRINKGGQKRDYAEDAAADSNGNAETREENGEEIAPAPGPLSFFDAIAGAMKHDDDAFAMTPDARDAAEERQRKRDLQDPLNLAWAAVYAAGAGTTDPDAPIAPEDELIRGTVGVRVSSTLAWLVAVAVWTPCTSASILLLSGSPCAQAKIWRVMSTPSYQQKLLANEGRAFCF